MENSFKYHPVHKALFSALCVLLTAYVPATAAPFDASNALDPAYSGQSRPYGRPAAAIGEGFGGREDEELDVPEGEVTEENKDSIKFVLYPAIGAGVTWDDNFFAEPDDTNSATIYRVYGAVGVRASKGNTNMGINLGVTHNSYHVEGGENFDTTTFNNLLSADISRAGEKIQAGANATYRRGQDEKGGIEDNVDHFDQWDQTTLAGWVNFGNPAARMNLRLDARTGARVQDDLSAIDVQSTAYAAMLKARVGSKTYGVLEGGVRYNDYDNSNQSANTVYGRLGVTWEATAKTTGFFSYGREQYNPDNPGEKISSGEEGPAFGVIAESTNDTWRGSFGWEATRNDSLQLASTRGVRISSGTGSHKVATRNTASWSHIWSDRIRSNLAYASGEDVFKGTTRVDDLDEYQVNMSYNFRRDMMLSGGWYYIDRASTVESGNYDRNRFEVNFNWEL